jgi:hypothetical protein
MGANKKPTLITEPQIAVFIAADLSLTEDSKRKYADITSGFEISNVMWRSRSMRIRMIAKHTSKQY